MKNENFSTVPSATDQPVSVTEWIVTILLTAIPVVNIIMLFIWGFGGSTAASKANWAKASLVWLAIGGAIWLIFFVVLGSLLFPDFS